MHDNTIAPGRLRPAEQTQLLSSTLKDLFAAQEPDKITQNLYSKIAGPLGLDAFINFMRENGDESMTLRSYAGISDDVAQSLNPLPLNHTLSGKVVKTRQFIEVADIQNSNELELRHLKSLGFLVCTCSPLMVGDRLLGTLGFASRTRKRFHSDEIEFLQIVAQYAAIAIDRLNDHRVLQRSQERMVAFFKATSIGSAILTPDAKFVEVNDAFCDITGYSRNELLSSDYATLMHPQDLDRLLQNLDSLAANRIGKFDLEVRNIRKEGSIVWVQNDFVLVQDDSGQPSQLVLLCQDVSKRKQAEQMAQHRAAVVESSVDAIITKNLKGIITSWNMSAERIFGYRPEEVIGKPITVLFPSHSIDEEPKIIARIQKGELVDHFETIRRKKDGTLFPVSLTISPIRDMSGKIIGASKIARDISPQKEYENKLLEQANELEQFAFVASHDLQEPLRKVSIYTELLNSISKEFKHADADKYAGYISDAVKRMQQLIKDLLDYSRTGRSESIEKIELERVLQDVIIDLEIPIKENNATVTWDPLPIVDANAFQTHQLFQNFLSNAMKFRGDEPPKIHVSSRTDNGVIIIGVKDNGIGIDPKYQDQIFRVFQRLHPRDQYPGTGIGLAICKKIVERNGGKIWVESSPGKGSTFFFSF